MKPTISSVNLHRIMALAALSALVSSSVLYSLDFYPLTRFVDLLVGFFLLTLLAFRRRLSHEFKLSALIWAGLLVGVVMFVQNPFAVDGMLILSAAMVLSFANWHGRKIWLIPAVSISCTALMSLLIGLSIIQFRVEDVPDYNNVAVWFMSFQSQLIIVIVTSFAVIELKERLHAKINELAKANDAMFRVAYIDRVTGVSNWHYFEQMVTQRIELARPFSILSLSCQSTKQVVALHGQQKLQECLQRIGELCLAASNGRGFVAFSNGDNFLYLTDSTDRDYLAKAYTELLQSLSADEQLARYELAFSASATEYPLDGRSFYDLIHNLHLVPHEAAAADSKHLQFFDENIKRNVLLKNALRSRIKSAIHDRKFFAAYQSKISTKGGSIVGFEGLARMDSSDGFVSPGQFIPIINDEGWMEEFSYLMVDIIIGDIPAFIAKFGSEIRISANVSPPVFISNDFVRFVGASLQKYQVSGHNLTIEITEEVFATNFEKVIEHCEAFRAMGISISLDDFGSGFSSLNYLQLVKFDEIKLDRAFANNIQAKENALLLMRSICQLISQLGSKSVVEGIEQLEQYNLIEPLADEVQGFYFSKPQPISAILGSN